ncbi:MAG TPA: glycosyltransferase family 4 protein [Gemmatimonadaceae bacterium]|nr:glycosyltransferase family 4 protein [Gemmatimonadaceae bacterium]
MRRLRILTWHVHGNYLLDLTQIPHDFWVPFKPGRPHPYAGRAGDFPWPDNLHELPAEAVRDETFDWVIFQSKDVYHDNLLSDAQRAGPRLFIEHDPPLTHPFAEPHPVDDPDVTVVHVTPWNALMWDTGRSRAHVIEHGVHLPVQARYSGEIPRGITAINNLHERGRRMGADLFDRARAAVPIDLVGLGTEPFGGLGPIPPTEFAPFIAHYRFFFSPVRQTSLSLAMIEAMMAGLPVVGLATGEMATVIENGVSGYIDTSLDRVIDAARALLHDPEAARRLGEGARRTACQRFAIDRFARDWDALLQSGSASCG